jgi:hypothetical protein
VHIVQEFAGAITTCFFRKFEVICASEIRVLIWKVGLISENRHSSFSTINST